MTTQTTQGIAGVNGARLWYEVAGAGPPLVMLHGHLVDSGQWDDQFQAFARHYRSFATMRAASAVRRSQPIRSHTTRIYTPY